MASLWTHTYTTAGLHRAAGSHSHHFLHCWSSHLRRIPWASACGQSVLDGCSPMLASWEALLMAALLDSNKCYNLL